MMDPRQEKFVLEAVVAAAITTTPRICQAVIAARKISNTLSFRKDRLEAAILLTQSLLDDLEEHRRELGWTNERSDAA